MVKRFLALFMCLVFMLSFVLVTPAYAASASDYVSGDFFSWVFEAGFHTMAGIVSPFFDDICPSAPGLTTEHSFVKKTTTVGGKTGLYYVCEYCGKSAGEVGTEAYQQQVEALPAQGYQSDGSLLWSPKSLYIGAGFVRSSQSGFFYCPHYLGDCDSMSGYDRTFNCDNNSFSVIPSSGYSDIRVDAVQIGWYDPYPINGFYRLVKSLAFHQSAVGRYSSLLSGDVFYLADSSGTYFNSGDVSSSPLRRYTIMGSGATSGYYRSFSAQCYPPVFEVTAFTFVGDTETSYNINSRPTSITGDYGIIGDNGQITKVDGDYIVNETTNTYYNPATGTTTPIVDWSYDYGDRTYSLTLEGELSAEVQFGDDNVTINETTVNESGDTITNNYTIYYLVDGGGSGTEDPDPSPSPSPSPSDTPACVHTWTETSRTEPTCTTAGKVMSTCSKCNQTKTETIPATGHTWVVERTVQTTYDDSGNLLQQGYTIYMCSVCGEQYKDVDSTGPPGGAGDDDSDSGVISEIIVRLKAIYDEISETVQGFFGQFTDFLKAVFPFLPEEFFTILLLGALLMVIVAVLRKLIS